jgi:hypothetical protein
MFFGSFERSEVPTHKERVQLLLKFRFREEFFDFVSGHSELRIVKLRLNLS